jgi:DNA-binding FadR family transcriptional regulator
MRTPERQLGSIAAKASSRHPPTRASGKGMAASLDSLLAQGGRRPTVRHKARSVAAAIRGYVEDAIATGALLPGARLPTETELMASFRAGRNAVRSAMSALQAEGKIVRQVGSGSFVARPPFPSRAADAGALVQAAQSVARLANPFDVMELRLAFEPGAAAIAALRANLQEIEHMERVLARSAQAASIDEFERLDCELHMAFGRATKNVIVEKVYDIIEAAREHTAWGRLKERVLTGELRRRHTQEHERIVAAIRQRDGERARAEMKRHLDEINRIMFGRDRSRG